MSSEDLASLYQQVILDHSRERHGFGLQPTAIAQSHQINPTCGDEIRLQVHVDPSSGDVTSVSWEGQGCAISTASASVLTDIVENLSPEEMFTRIDHFRAVMRSKGAIAPDEQLLGDAVALQGVSRYVARIKCAMLPWVACEDAMHSATRQSGIAVNSPGLGVSGERIQR